MNTVSISINPAVNGFVATKYDENYNKEDYVTLTWQEMLDYLKDLKLERTKRIAPEDVLTEIA